MAPYLFNQNIELFDIVDSRYPDDIFQETVNILSLFAPGVNVDTLRTIYNDTVSLYDGEYPGYMSCSTGYHSLAHTLETFLALTRLMHGYVSDKEELSDESIMLGLTSALFHDTGYIQTVEEHAGTGAQFTLTHITRSIDFMEKYFSDRCFTRENYSFCSNCILCTNINTMTSEILFSSRQEGTVGKMLGIADLLSQLANRNYLENLTLLYREFKEGHVTAFRDQFDLYRKTVGFFDVVKARFREEFNSLDKFMIIHFQQRLNSDRDLYKVAIDNNAHYLEQLLETQGKDYLRHLRREGINR